MDFIKNCQQYSSGYLIVLKPTDRKQRFRRRDVPRPDHTGEKEVLGFISRLSAFYSRVLQKAQELVRGRPSIPVSLCVERPPVKLLQVWDREPAAAFRPLVFLVHTVEMRIVL